MKTYQDLTYDFLYDQYIIKQKTIRNIAKETNLTKKQIQRLIKKFKIKTRQSKPKSDTRLKYQDILTKTFLENKYINEKKSINEISIETNISSHQIAKYLNLYNIPRRTCGTRKGKKNKSKSIYNSDIKIGDQYELLTVIQIKDNQLICKCNCGNIKNLHISRIRNKQVKSCGCLSRRIGTQNPLYKGFGLISKSIFSRCKVNASDRNIEFYLTIEDLDNQYKKQNGKCAISNIDIGFNNYKQKNKRLSTASLDRIDSSKPYTIDNIQWIHKQIQQMKWNTPQNEFIEWCKIIAGNN